MYPRKKGFVGKPKPKGCGTLGITCAYIEIPSAYSEPITIEILKYKDILDLSFIEPIYNEFYNTIKSQLNQHTTICECQ